MQSKTNVKKTEILMVQRQLNLPEENISLWHKPDIKEISPKISISKVISNDGVWASKVMFQNFL